MYALHCYCFIALAFALNKMLKSYTLEIFMLCDNFMFWLSILKKMASKRDVRSYFSAKENESKCININ